MSPQIAPGEAVRLRYSRRSSELRSAERLGRQPGRVAMDAVDQQPDDQPDDRVLAYTRGLSLFIVPFLLVAFVILYLFPEHTARLWSWHIRGLDDVDGAGVGLPRRRVLLPPRHPLPTLARGRHRLPGGDRVREPARRRDAPALGPVPARPPGLLALGRPVLHRAVPGDRRLARQPPVRRARGRRRRPAPAARALGRRRRRARRTRHRGGPVPGTNHHERPLAVAADAAHRPRGRGDVLPRWGGSRRAGSTRAGRRCGSCSRSSR